jgi:hypothetical protein
MRRRYVLSALFALLLVNAVSEDAGAKGHNGGVHVRGYRTKSGRSVPPHNRTKPNKRKSDNWSTKGNVNPYTGKSGTKSEY